MPVVDATFSDGTRVHLNVSAPWWSWFWLGLIYQPASAEVTAVRRVSREVRHWWCLWLCTSTETVEDSCSVDSIVIEAKGFTSNDAGFQVTDQGSATCRNCSGLTHYVHNFGFPVPPWGGGGGFQGVGFRATVTYRNEIRILHNHWGSAGTLPADFL